MPIIKNRPMVVSAGTNEASGAASSSFTLPTDSPIVRVAATEHVYINFGGSSVDADNADILMLAGVEYFAVGLSTHIAHIQTTVAGIVSVCKAK